MASRFKAYYKFLIGLILLSVFIAIAFLSIRFGRSQVDDKHVSELDLNPADFYQHTPSMRFLTDHPEVLTELTEYDREQIQTRYAHAWYCLNTSLKTGTILCLEEYFAEPARTKIESLVHSSRRVNQVDMSHLLRVNQVSLDRQIVALSDVRLELYRQNQNNITVDKKAINLIMRLSEGTWKITDWIEQLPEDVHSNALSKTDSLKLIDVSKIDGVNYYPAKYPWREFWINFDADIMRQDFKKIVDLGFNTTRIFIPNEIFGGGHPDAYRLSDFKLLLDIAEESGLKVVPTLFDFPIGFTLNHYPAYAKQLKVLLESAKDHPAVLSWCLKNEPDLDFKYHDPNEVMLWLRFIISEARKINPEGFYTIGWSDARFGHLYADELDYVSVHYYKKSSEFDTDISRLKTKIGEKAICIEEYGKSSFNAFWYPFKSSEKIQKAYTRELRKSMDEQKLGGLVWSLYDFEQAPSNVFGWKPWVRSPQKYFGLYKIDGSQKEVVDLFVNADEDIVTNTNSTLNMMFFLFVILTALLFILSIFILRKVYIRFSH